METEEFRRAFVEQTNAKFTAEEVKGKLNVLTKNAQLDIINVLKDFESITNRTPMMYKWRKK